MPAGNGSCSPGRNARTHGQMLLRDPKPVSATVQTVQPCLLSSFTDKLPFAGVFFMVLSIGLWNNSRSSTALHHHIASFQCQGYSLYLPFLVWFLIGKIASYESSVQNKSREDQECVEIQIPTLPDSDSVGCEEEKRERYQNAEPYNLQIILTFSGRLVRNSAF